MTDYRNVMQRLLSMQENITNQVEAELELKGDKDPGFTKDIHDEFIKGLLVLLVFMNLMNISQRNMFTFLGFII